MRRMRPGERSADCPKTKKVTLMLYSASASKRREVWPPGPSSKVMATAPGVFNAMGFGVVRTVVVVVVVVVVLIVLTECTRFVVGKLLNSVVGTVWVLELASLVGAT